MRSCERIKSRAFAMAFEVAYDHHFYRLCVFENDCENSNALCVDDTKANQVFLLLCNFILAATTFVKKKNANANFFHPGANSNVIHYFTLINSTLFSWTTYILLILYAKMHTMDIQM